MPDHARRPPPGTRDETWPRQRVAVAALVICVGYFLGAQLGLQLRLPGATPSVMWPPNSLLTCALLLVPRRHWPVCLLAALPPHLTLTLGTDWPAPTIGLLFLTNCSEALIGASLLRRFSDAPTRFDSLDRVFAFLGCVVLAAPILSSFLDAAVVASRGVESYWDVWRTRTFSNVLTSLTIVPAVVGVITRIQRREAVSRSQRLEAVALVVLLIGVWIGISAWISEGNVLVPGTERAPLAFLLPFIAWAAMRFGPTGESVTVLLATLLTIVSASRGLSPFVSLSPGQTLLGVQLLVIAAALPHLVLAAAIEERRQGSQAIADRLSFERLLGQVSHTFLDARSDAMAEAYGAALRDAGERLGADGLLLYRVDRGRTVPEAGWFRSGPGHVPLSPEFPWGTAEILANREVLIQVVGDYPDHASEDRASFERYGFRAAFGVPLASADGVLGCLCYVSSRSSGEWAPDALRRFRLVAEIFGTAMARQATETALRGSESLKTAILSSLAIGVAVIDRRGCIIASNERWTALARDAAQPWADAGIGDDLLAACARAVDDHTSQRLREGTMDVLSGRTPRFLEQHSRAGPGGARYWVLTVHPLDRADGGAVVTHADVTERKRAELEAQEARAELAHLARVTAVGELTASIAHQLNQPLAAIVANAQAGRRLLAKADAADLPAVLQDIATDGLRAGAVIQRLREMLRKESPTLARVDLAAVARDVADLVANDALIRKVGVQVWLPPAPVVVEGDRIQLQQVMLNLLMNAMDAAADGGSPSRLVEVDARSADGHTAVVDVRDSGPGLPAPIGRVFDAFYTTKPSGIGMGLPIARSIVEAHGGSLHAANNPRGGATFRVRLPLARQAQA